ncbi:MAG: hypothetical protein HC819_14875 [Cyclobacteriaceae bacterium]|nr:hypothetical protein [Cyclobacteriaceae bacterium]
MSKRRITDKEAYKAWTGFFLQFIEDVVVDSSETESDKILRKARLEANPEEWFQYYFPKYCTAEPATFHKSATKRLLNNKRWYEVRAWSRELAKSSRSMMEFLYMSLTGEIKNVVLVSNSWDNAVRLLLPFKLNLERNKRIINDYGDQQAIGQWEADEFTTRSGCSFRALGAGQSPRGTKNENVRPDAILIDDIDTDEECRNPERIKTKWEWIEQALIPTVSVSGNCRILFNGNIIAKYCCITEAMKKADKHTVVNIRDKHGKSTWPYKNKESDIDYILSKISFISAQKEYYNNPVSVGDVFKEMTWGKCPGLSKFNFIVAYADPATSNKDKKGASTKAVVMMGFANDKFYVINCFLDATGNENFVQWFYDIRALVGDKTQVYYVIENNTLQDPFFEQVFMPLFAKFSKDTGYTLPISPDTRKKPDKFARIEGNLEPLNRASLLVLNEAEKGNPHMQRLEEQFLAVTPKLTVPADGPDAVEGGVWIINQKLSRIAQGDIWVGKKRRTKRF